MVFQNKLLAICYFYVTPFNKNYKMTYLYFNLIKKKNWKGKTKVMGEKTFVSIVCLK